MKRAARVAALVALGLAMVTGRVLWSSRVEWRDAEQLLAAGDRERAVDHFGRAARLYAPGNPWSTRSLDRLEELARRAEEGGEREAALGAWRELRSAVLATRAVYAPNAARRAVADARIAVLAAALESPSIDPSASEEARRSWHAARLARSDEPSPIWSLLALLGYAAFLASALGFLLRGLDDHDRLVRWTALRFALGACAALALFVIGLARA